MKVAQILLVLAAALQGSSVDGCGLQVEVVFSGGKCAQDNNGNSASVLTKQELFDAISHQVEVLQLPEIDMSQGQFFANFVDTVRHLEEMSYPEDEPKGEQWESQWESERDLIEVTTNCAGCQKYVASSCCFACFGTYNCTPKRRLQEQVALDSNMIGNAICGDIVDRYLAGAGKGCLKGAQVSSCKWNIDDVAGDYFANRGPDESVLDLEEGTSTEQEGVAGSSASANLLTFAAGVQVVAAFMA